MKLYYKSVYAAFQTFVFVLIMFFSKVDSIAQSLSIDFHATGKNLISPNNVISFHISEQDSVKITEFRFYISKISFWKSNKQIWIEEESYHLIDLLDDSTHKINLKTPDEMVFDKLEFYLGIDSLTNVSGAMGGDLDPTRGMYWTWQNGYINTKIEGTSNVCKSRKNEFQFHLGGYITPFQCVQKIEMNVDRNEEIQIGVNVEEIIEAIDLAKQTKIMSPSLNAVEISKQMAKCFHLMAK
jgi:hypothetical protein